MVLSSAREMAVDEVAGDVAAKEAVAANPPTHAIKSMIVMVCDTRLQYIFTGILPTQLHYALSKK